MNTQHTKTSKRFKKNTLSMDSCSTNGSCSTTKKCSSTKCRYARISQLGLLFIAVLLIAQGVKTYIGSSISSRESQVEALTQQQSLFQQITTEAVNLKTSHAEGNNVQFQELQQSFQQSYQQFESGLLSLTEGGQIIGANETEFEVQPVALNNNLTTASTTWNGGEEFLTPIYTEDLSSLSAQDVNAAVDYLNQNSQNILGNFSNLTSTLKNQVSSRQNIQSSLDWGALILGIGIFIYVTSFGITGLRQRDKELADSAANLEQNYLSLAQSNATLESTQTELYNSNSHLQQALHTVQQTSYEAQHKATELEQLANTLKLMKQESDTIFDAVDHGLCLIDAKGFIGSRVSKATTDILEVDDIVNKSFVEIMSPYITEKDLKTLKSYINLQFNKNTKKKQLIKYNPLKSIELTMNWDGNKFKTKNLGFKFERIMDGDTIAAVLITITDITDTVILENELLRNTEEQKRKTGLILEIVQADPRKLDRFLTQTQRSLVDINHLLKQNDVSEDTESSGKDILEDVYRHVHNIKGNASMLSLKTIVNVTHDVENNLSGLRLQQEVKGEEFLSSILQLGTLREYIDSYIEIKDELLRDFRNSSRKVEEKPLTQTEQLALEVTEFNHQLAEQLDKEVHTHCKLDLDELSPSGISSVKDIIIQLTRNSIVHGIEKPAQRRELGKVEEAIIQVICDKDTSSDNILGQPLYRVTFRDDGSGINLNKVRRKAIELKLIDEASAEELSDMELTALIFKPEFSTVENANQHAGRGVGLDIVKHKVVQQFNGKMFIDFIPDSHTQFSFLIPALALESQNQVKSA